MDEMSEKMKLRLVDTGAGNRKQVVDGDTAYAEGAPLIHCAVVKIRIFHKSSYASPEYYEDAINAFLEDLAEKRLQISLTFFESMTYIVYQTK